ncbi:hypothetical protein KIPB_001437 [Kipferlia bialata]|uniref:Uncharacterized protein n=1 Tax=Kipferlia bialata TaxID=797122 RepID=A0A9K3CNX1_9EUKA|nr:hypothetical protein KIPB_001437 [Kipferlia bialata]|eukprot:g1437.t1
MSGFSPPPIFCSSGRSRSNRNALPRVFDLVCDALKAAKHMRLQGVTRRAQAYSVYAGLLSSELAPATLAALVQIETG